VCPNANGGNQPLPNGLPERDSEEQLLVAPLRAMSRLSSPFIRGEEDRFQPITPYSIA